MLSLRGAFRRARSPRLRRGTSLCELLGCDCSTGIASPGAALVSEFLPESVYLCFELCEVAVVVDDVGGEGQAFFSTGLGRDPLGGVVFGESAEPHQTIGRSVWRKIHNDDFRDVVRIGLFCEQSHVEDNDVLGWALFGNPSLDLDSQGRMDDRFQGPEFIGVIENYCCDSRSVQCSIVGHDILSPPLDYCGKDRFAWSLKFPNYRIGVDDYGPARAQLIRDGRFPGTDSTGESYEAHISRLGGPFGSFLVG